MAQKTLPFMEPGNAPENEHGRDADTMAPRDASALIREAGADELLRFWDGMGLARDKITRDMHRYNETVADDIVIMPYEHIEEFIVDAGVRAKIAAIYNDKRSGRCESYVEAANRTTLVPSKQRKRRMVDAFRARVARDAARTLSPPEDWERPTQPR